ncbi:hypothetical protein E3N88_00237 [Mikania micrantha]|uniref:Prolyl 4-hydroxylase alpha subunit domain-containing protein n=1 Tax=Mikania micrantha TaxID=192012 RepID=A0A5N6PZH7_9ASTR|nr:hypothetical protein E3N88_00237 [Mikania micrantha]
MRKGRNVFGRRHQGKRSSTVALVLSMLLMLTIVLLVLLALGIFSLPIGSDDDSSSYLRDRITFKRQRLLVGDIDGDGIGNKRDQWTEILSWEPRAFVYHNFLSKEECDYLINLAKPHMAKSTVVDSKTGQSKDSRCICSRCDKVGRLGNGLEQ